MERTFKIINKGLRGKDEVPTVVFKGDGSERLVLEVDTKKQLNNFNIDEQWTVKIAKEQQQIG